LYQPFFHSSSQQHRFVSNKMGSKNEAAPPPTFQISLEHLPSQQLLALSRVELFLLLNSPRRGVKKNGAF
jgi:hypothetical protein